MPNIASVAAGYYRVPLETTLSDSMHGDILAFELNTVRLSDAEGAEGVGYTFTVGRNGAAIDAILRRDIPNQMIGQDADRIEWLWQKVWCGRTMAAAAGPPSSPSPPWTWRCGISRRGSPEAPRN